MVKNEEDVIEHVVRHMLAHVDQVVVADNLSSDRTREILDSIGDERLVVVNDNDPAYRQSEKMSALADLWARTGDWVVPFDADELWNTTGGKRLGDFLKENKKMVVAGRPWVHVPQDSAGPHYCPFESMPHRVVVQEQWPKAALRWSEGMTIEQGNHWTSTHIPDTLDIRHFQYRSLDHLIRKVRDGAESLVLANLPPGSGAHWRQMAALSDDNLAAQWELYVNQPTVFDRPTCLACAI